MRRKEMPLRALPDVIAPERALSPKWHIATEGLDATLHKKKAADRQYRKLDGAQEAQLITRACSQPPAGQARWTLKLLAQRLVELEVVEAIDPSTVWRTLKKTSSSLG